MRGRLYSTSPPAKARELVARITPVLHHMHLKDPCRRPCLSGQMRNLHSIHSQGTVTSSPMWWESCDGVPGAVANRANHERTTFLLRKPPVPLLRVCRRGRPRSMTDAQKRHRWFPEKERRPFMIGPVCNRAKYTILRLITSATMLSRLPPQFWMRMPPASPSNPFRTALLFGPKWLEIGVHLGYISLWRVD